VHAGWKTTHGMDGQHHYMDRTIRGRVNQNDRGQINGESTSMVWPTLGSRTAEEQNRTDYSNKHMVVSGSKANRKPPQIAPLGIRIQPDLRAVGFLRRNVCNCSIPATPPWLLKRLHIDFSIYQSFEDNISSVFCRNKFFEFCDHYKDFSRLYTDGCRMGDQVGAVVMYRSTTKTIRLPNTASICSAILLANGCHSS